MRQTLTIKPSETMLDTVDLIEAWRKARMKRGQDPIIQKLITHRAEHLKLNIKPVIQQARPGSLNGMLMRFHQSSILTCIDLFSNPACNNSFSIVGSYEAGKSFLANEIALDVITRGGQVRVLDAQNSYSNLSDLLGGSKIPISIDAPVSFNPFWGLNEQQLLAMMPVLKNIICQIVFQDHTLTSFHYKLIEKAILVKHGQYGERLETRSIWEWFVEEGSEAGKAAAMRLEPYAKGQYSTWFNGEPLELDNYFVVFSLEDFKLDGNAPEIIFSRAIRTYILAYIARDMYLQDWTVPKLLLIDEAVFLNSISENFIRSIFKHVQNYFGVVGLLLLSFASAEGCSAIGAAYSEANWRFVLEQSGHSLTYAKQNKMLYQHIDEETLYNLLSYISKPEADAGYSEVYIQNKLEEGLFKFMVDKFSYLTFSSYYQDAIKLNNIQIDYGVNLEQAIAIAIKSEALREASLNTLLSSLNLIPNEN